METILKIIICIAIVVTAAYIVAAATIFIVSILGGLADEKEKNEQ